MREIAEGETVAKDDQVALAVCHGLLKGRVQRLKLGQIAVSYTHLFAAFAR